MELGHALLFLCDDGQLVETVPLEPVVYFFD